MGLEALLRVLREEAVNEERTLRQEAAREAARVVEEARAASAQAQAAAIAREGEARAQRLRAVRDAAGREREREVLGEARRQLDLLRAEALAALPALVTTEDVARFVGELVAEAGPVVSCLRVDPGHAEAARRVVESLGRAPAPEVREVEVRRGGVELVTGALVLDDTVASRLERAWPRVEPEIARLLLGEG